MKDNCSKIQICLVCGKKQINIWDDVEQKQASLKLLQQGGKNEKQKC